MKAILITGSAGFIGFHLAQTLLNKGILTIGLDNFNDYYSPALKRKRADLLIKKGMTLVEGDICDTSLINKLIEDHGITHIAHLAAQAGVRYSLTNPQAYLHANIEGFLSILEACRKKPSVKLVYASSSSVYGLNEKVPFSEMDRTDRQASLYGATKKSNELFAQTYHHLFGFSVVGLRFFTVYGPWGRPDMAYFSFAKSILEEKPIHIFNQGKMKRDFTYVDDIIAGIEASLELDHCCEIFNLGNHKPVELMKFLKILEKSLNKEAIIEFKPMQPGDVVETYADIEHSQKILGFSPRTSLEEGIPRFVQWLLENKKFL